MNPQTIDPYEQWLGIKSDAGRPDYYRLLGLRPLEADSQAIAAAADRAKARVRGFKPGAFARQWAALLDELDRAKATLLDPLEKAEYDAGLAIDDAASASDEKPASLAMATLSGEVAEASDLFLGEFALADPTAFAPPGALTKSTAAKRREIVPPPEQPNKPLHPAAQLLGFGGADDPADDSKAPARAMMGDASATLDPAIDPFDPMAPVSFDDADEPAMPERPAAPIPAAPTPIPLIPVAPIPIAPIPAAESVAETITAREVCQPQPHSVPVFSPARPVGRPLTRRNRSTPRWVFTAAVAGVLAALLGLVGYLASGGDWFEETDLATVDAPDDSNPRDGVTKQRTERTPRASANLTEQAMETTPGPLDGTPAEIPTETIPTEIAPAEVMPTEMPPAEPPAEPPAIDPAPTQEPMPATPVTSEEAALLAASLKAARAALSKNDVAAAQGEIAKARPLARTPPYSPSYEQLAALVEKTAEFWAAFDRGLASLAPGNELRFGSTKVKFVQATGEQLSYEVVGLKRRSGLRDLPLGLAIAVAERGMTDPASAESKVVKGAPLAGQTNEALVDQARARWQEAEKQGASVQDLLAAIADVYDFGAARAAGDSTAGMSSEWGKLLSAARQALGDNDVERALAELGRAERLASDAPPAPEERAKFERLRLLADYLSQFWNIVGDSLAGLVASEEILVGNEPVIVVAATRDSLEVRRQAKNRQFARNQIPADLALALAHLRLRENDPATKMMAAALYAIQKDPAHHDTARKLWSEAGAAGADVGDLPSVLEDQY